MALENSFLGKGWSFPPRFNKDLEEVTIVSNETDIEESLQIILSTRLGERVMRPGFGCNLDRLIFESLNIQLITKVKNLVETAILHFEPRIDLDRIEINASDEIQGIVRIEIDYTVRSTNSRRNLVYPFYRGEGTDV